MNAYIIHLVDCNFSRQIDEPTAINSAHVSGLFASFKFSFLHDPVNNALPVFFDNRLRTFLANP